MSKYLGKMYIAKRPCGKVVAATWIDKGSEKEIAESVARWIKRGNTVEIVDRYDGDKSPEWVCKECKGSCKTSEQ